MRGNLVDRTRESAKWCLIVSGISYLLFGSLAEAQAVPSGVEPGLAEREFDEPIAPKSTRRIIVPKPGAEAPPENAANIEFKLRELRIDGSTIYRDADLRPLYDRLLGTDITLSTVFAIANAITKKYSDDGYALSIGFVPAQEIEDGFVRLAVAEGYVSDVEIRGSGRYPLNLLKRFSNKIESSRPLRTSVLERYLLLANDLPGLDVRGTFERGNVGSGATRLILDVSQSGLYGGFSYGNRGSRALGPVRVGTSAGVHSLGRRGGDLSYDRIVTEDGGELVYQALGVSIPLGSDGTLLSLSLIDTESEPGTEDLEALEFISDGRSGSLVLSYPWVRSRSQNLTTSIIFDYKDLKSAILALTNSEDNLRVLRLDVSYDFLDRFNGTTRISAKASHGFDLFGATENASLTKSRADGVFDFTSANLGLYRVQRMGSRVSFVTEISSQYAVDQLLSSEQCGYGGGRYGRGYDSFEFAGDHCAKASVELQMNRNGRNEKVEGYQFFAYYDGGKVWQRGTVLPGELKDETATSAGFGVRVRLVDSLRGSVEYSKPLDRDVALERNDDGRVFFSLEAWF